MHLTALFASWGAMDVLIVERDELARSLLADALDAEGISAAVASDEEALTLPMDEAPQVVITGINRSYNEDLGGLKMVAAMRRKWPQLCTLFLAALWPADLHRDTLTARERFLTKPFLLAQMTSTVRELLDSGLCRRPG
jgi:DNA-binding response OmpR family regulator